MAYALAAALFLAAAAVAIYVAAFNARPETRAPRLAAPLASITDTSPNATLVVNDNVVGPGSEVRVGDITLDRGSADLRLDNGVAVTLRGQTQLTVRDPHIATLTAGSARFDCPHSVKGYTVHLPHGVRVVDLGTTFQIETDRDGRSHIAVTEGRVRVERDGVASVELAAGDSIAVDDSGVLRPIDRVALVGMDTDPSPIYVYRDGDPREFSLGRDLDSFTLAAWVRVDSLPREFNALLMDDGWEKPGDLHWQVLANGTVQLAIFGDDNATAPHFYTNQPLPIGRWVHLAVAFDRQADTVAYYFDGRAVPTIASRGYRAREAELARVIADAWPRIGNASIARWKGVQNRELDGAVQSLAIYDAALDADTIASMAASPPATSE